MKMTLLIAAAVIVASTSIGSFAGRTGDQLVIQERENKRVAEERRQMHDMMQRCATLMETMDKSH